MRKHEFAGGEASAAVLEREARQNEALRVVNGIARATGTELPVLAHEGGRFSDKPGIYLLDPDVIKNGPIKDASFNFDQRMLSGAADSAHAVIAGQLTVKHESGLHVPATAVAAKCYQKRTFDERLARAEREVEVMRDMNNRGELALDPVAVAIAPDRQTGDTSVVLFTRFNDSLYTLDNNPWGRGPTPFNVQNAADAAGALGRFNSMGWQHRDAKIKNVASVAGLGVGMIDFETTDPFDPNDPNAARDAAYADLDYFVSSLGDKDFLKRKQNRDFSDNSDQIVGAVQAVCDSYLGAWGDASPDVQAQVLEVTMDVADNATRRAFGEAVNV